MVKFVYSLLITCVLVTSVSCNDNDFLNENPSSFYTPDNIFSSSTQVKQVLVSCNKRIRDLFFLTNGSMDVAQSVFKANNGTDLFDVPVIRNKIRFNDYSILSSETPAFNNYFSEFYKIIADANLAIYAANLSNIKWESEKDKLAIEAQARFFRAFCYRNLGELFGGVPLVTSIETEPKYDYQRSSRIETYQFAIDEMEEILFDIPETSEKPGDIVRAAVYHNLCQLYIDKGVVLSEEGKDATKYFDKAIEYANNVIDGGTYHLMTERFGTRKNENPDFYFANLQKDQIESRLYSKAGYIIEGNVFWDLFQEGNQNYQEGNKEAIWVIQIDYDAHVAEDVQSHLRYSSMYGPVFRSVETAHVKGQLEDVGGLGMCLVCPTFYARDSIYSGKWSVDMRNSEAVFRRCILGNVETSKYFGKPVPWSVLYSSNENVENRRNGETLAYPISCKISTDKYHGPDFGNNRQSLFRDEYMIRLAETILLRAEAKLRKGDKQGAADDINLLRRRAKCEYLVVPNDINIDLILDERARELLYEEKRWNTLLRMGGNVATNRIKKYSYWDYPRNYIREFNLWPIPQTVIDVNKDCILEQNKGW